MKKEILLIILCGVCLLGLTGCGMKKEYKAKITDKDGNKVEMTYSETIKEFKKNETAFNSKYITGKIVVSGKIKEINSGDDGISLGTYDLCGTYGEPYDNQISIIILEDGWEITLWTGRDKVDINDLQVGDKITVKTNISRVKSNERENYIGLASYDGEEKGSCTFGDTPTVVVKK